MTMLHLGDELKTRKTFQDCDHHYLVAADSVNNLEKPDRQTQTKSVSVLYADIRVKV
jgi:hypothetical protein